MYIFAWQVFYFYIHIDTIMFRRYIVYHVQKIPPGCAGREEPHRSPVRCPMPGRAAGRHLKSERLAGSVAAACGHAGKSNVRPSDLWVRVSQTYIFSWQVFYLYIDCIMCRRYMCWLDHAMKQEITILCQFKKRRRKITILCQQSVCLVSLYLELKNWQWKQAGSPLCCLTNNLTVQSIFPFSYYPCLHAFYQLYSETSKWKRKSTTYLSTHAIFSTFASVLSADVLYALDGRLLVSCWVLPANPILWLGITEGPLLILLRSTDSSSAAA